MQDMVIVILERTLHIPPGLAIRPGKVDLLVLPQTRKCSFELRSFMSAVECGQAAWSGDHT
jgi:hypothetical protein